MTYAWARDFILQLINQYTIAGQQVLLSYNNQSDYVNRIPNLLNDAQVYVATTVRRMRELVPLRDMSLAGTMGQWDVYELPVDCWQITSAGLIRENGKDLNRYHRYKLLGGNRLAVPRGTGDEFVLEYFRYPKQLSPSPSDTDELDNTVEVQMAVPYYVAAHLVMYDNEFAYASLMNEFESKCERLYELPQTELNIVEDVYDALDWRDWE